MISVIVPAYNAVGTLGICLHALNQQTVPRDQYEVIVVDDGSTDKTASVAESFGVQVIRQRNKGPAAARNRGAEAAHGDVIAFTDADCEPASNWLFEITRPLDDPDIVGVKGVYRTWQKTLIARFVQMEYEDKYVRLRRYKAIDFVDTYSAAYRRRVFLQAGGFDPAFPRASGEDIDLSYRLSRLGCRMVFAPDAAVYHNHPPHWQSYFRRKFYVGYWRVRMYQKSPEKVIADSHTPQVMKLQMVLVCLAAAGLTIVFSPLSIWVVLGALILFWLTTIPFSLRCWSRDERVALWAFPLLILRATALTLGVGWGVMAYLIVALRGRA